MATKIIKEYHTSGYIYDDGEIPECDYCGKNEEETSISPTAHSGVMCCSNQECMNDYMNNNILCDSFEVVEKKVVVCDRCDETDDVSDYHVIEGEDVCDYCIEEEER